MNLDDLDFKLDIEHQFQLVCIITADRRVPLLSFNCVNNRKVVIQYLIDHFTEWIFLIEMFIMQECKLDFRSTIGSTVSDILNIGLGTNGATVNNVMINFVNNLGKLMDSPEDIMKTQRPHYCHLLDQPLTCIPQPDLGIFEVHLQLQETLNQFYQRLHLVMQESALEIYQELRAPTKRIYGDMILTLVMDDQLNICALENLSQDKNVGMKVLGYQVN